MASVYTKTATVAKSGKIYAFGKSDSGYILFVKKSTYCGQKRGGLDHHWVVVEQRMGHQQAMDLMNKKCGYKAFGE